MNMIIRILVLLVLLLLWACCGSYLLEGGQWLNSCIGAEWPGYVLSAGLAVLCLWLLGPLPVSLGRAVFSRTPLRLRYMLVWGGILLLLYFGADVVDKGIALNDLTSYPLLGYLFWGIIACFLYWQVVAPIISFCRLTPMHTADAGRRAGGDRRLRERRSDQRGAARRADPRYRRCGAQGQVSCPQSGASRKSREDERQYPFLNAA